MYRAGHAARMKSGLARLQRPATRWDCQPLSEFISDSKLADVARYAEYRRSSSPRFFFDPKAITVYRQMFDQWDNAQVSPMAAADDVGRGIMQFFSHEWVDVGFPPNWHRDPFHDVSFPTDRHWSQIGDFGASDIKLVWEMNRFGFIFPLVRSYWRTGNEQYCELFWNLVENWQASNPPDAGANWKCGQEISLRVMAWCFGLYGFLHSPASTPDRIAMLAQMIAVSGGRIEFNIGYALSQQNNHGISEAMGLWTIGSLFPEFADSSRWAALGRRLLENQAQELIYDDGAFAQHSMNYHRVMLHDYLWSMRLADVQEQPFSQRMRERIGLASQFLYQLQDEFTGRVPCYGQNDGALILPLTNCDYRDFRPVVQATHFLATGRRCLNRGPWDEELLWMFGPTSSATEVAPNRHDFDGVDSGYATLRSPTGFALARAASFRHRPAQADMLHVDVWWRGQNIALDPGTYSYNAPSPWDNRLAHTSFHNTVTVDDQDQMERAGRFLWLPWLSGKSFGRQIPCTGDTACWNGEHHGYRRLFDPVTHRRGVIRLGADHWLIVDSLQGGRPHSFRLHWLLVDVPFEWNASQKSLELHSPAGRYRVASASSAESEFGVIRAASDSPAGWCSPYYHAREPAISVSLQATATRIVFATVLGPDAQAPILANDSVGVVGPDWNVTASLNLVSRGGMPLVAAVDAEGSILYPESSTSNSYERPLAESHTCTSC